MNRQRQGSCAFFLLRRCHCGAHHWCRRGGSRVCVGVRHLARAVLLLLLVLVLGLLLLLLLEPPLTHGLLNHALLLLVCDAQCLAHGAQLVDGHLHDHAGFCGCFAGCCGGVGVVLRVQAGVEEEVRVLLLFSSGCCCCGGGGGGGGCDWRRRAAVCDGIAAVVVVVALWRRRPCRVAAVGNLVDGDGREGRAELRRCRRGACGVCLAGRRDGGIRIERDAGHGDLVVADGDRARPVCEGYFALVGKGIVSSSARPGLDTLVGDWQVSLRLLAMGDTPMEKEKVGIVPEHNIKTRASRIGVG
ncbi:uncharacterized protein B0I36DRAFT_355657 [Microdochium trichocladiopsis]|uniref:Uncharacterized protein n=1 Tax=Microdochium trichocladiopsis TaxID=1682393 RepID=A0A9P9BIK5_9PEZI|nr:uncharacterized protein B0I36DRAFT_355657 [Microdochium trichocladiopsis]KAH7014445.1 hypothetical protein B0I36DRAFT_355657 [Microdochium trichocladiopsis]